MKYFKIEQFDKTGLVKTIYTTAENKAWGFYKEGSIHSYESLGKMFGITPRNMVRTHQMHTSAVRCVTSEDGGNFILHEDTHEGYDGLVTNEPQLMLCTLQADCVPVYILDPVHKAIAMVHSGWKGTAGKIAANAVLKMSESYGTNAADCLAAMGPCICKNCYEVSEDLIGHFEASFAKDAVKKFFTPKPNGKYLLDLPLAIRTGLLEIGVKNENIFDPDYCTFTNEMFPSYRRNTEDDGRILTGIMLV